MFRSLYEAFDPTVQQQLDANITRYATTEQNLVTGSTTSNYSFPNTGLQTQQQQSSDSALQGALGILGNSSTGGGVGLAQILTGPPDDLGVNLQACRQYQGLTGLSNLQASPLGTASGGSRCGWRYKPGLGPVPQVAQAAYGNSSGPLDTSSPQTDSIGNGTKYYWDLQAADKAMVTDICKSATSCMDMTAVPITAVGNFKDLCGYCTTSQKVIPIKRQGNTVMPRYGDVDSQCSSDKIITADNAKTQCPAPDPGAPPQAQQPYWKCFNTPLDRDCVALTAQFAGCSPGGTLAAALSQGTNQQDYADKLRLKKSFQVYQSLANPVLNDDVIRQGNGTLFASFMNFWNVNRSMYATDNEKLSVSARDLCQQTGLYEQYNFCSDLTDGTREFEANCMQKEFLARGGNVQGTAYPKDKAAASGKTWGEYKKSLDTLVTATRSTDATTQRNALNQLTGLGLQAIPTSLPRGENNQGTEVFWFDRQNGGVLMGRRPVMSVTGSNIPNFDVGGGEVEGTGLYDWVEFVSFCDLRPVGNMNLKVGVVTDDGFAWAINQDIFNITDWSRAFSRYYDQAPSWHQSDCVPVSADSTNRPNIFSLTYFETGGGATFRPYFMDCAKGNWEQPAANGNVSAVWKDMCYFTQEVEAPALSFQPYQRKNTLQFCEKRMWSKFLTAAQPKTVRYGPVTNSVLAPGTNAMTLANSTWFMNKSIAFTGFRTVTLCFSLQDFNSNGQAPLFLWGFQYGYVMNIAKVNDVNYTVTLQSYFPGQNGVTSTAYTIEIGKWYMATLIQVPISSFSKNIGSIKFFVQSVENLAAGKIAPAGGIYSFSAGGTLLKEYKADRSSRGSVSINGFFGNNPAQMTTSVAWVHFFDQEFNTTDPAVWKKEVTSGWQGRWFE